MGGVVEPAFWGCFGQAFQRLWPGFLLVPAGDIRDFAYVGRSPPPFPSIAVLLAPRFARRVCSRCSLPVLPSAGRAFRCFSAVLAAFRLNCCQRRCCAISYLSSCVVCSLYPLGVYECVSSGNFSFSLSRATQALSFPPPVSFASARPVRL